MPVMNIPPIKIQGIKTKLVPLIRRCLPHDPEAVWVEPFMGSGVVGFNLAGKRAVFADINPYTIDFYQQLQKGVINALGVRSYLEEQAPKLRAGDADYYYFIRERFNKEHHPLDFLFLNRACFNGMVRFNRKGEFNVPYGHKPERFAKAYITKITNQVAALEQKLQMADWKFICQPFGETIRNAEKHSFIYCDPPYIGRHVDYYDSWDESQELALHKALMESHCPFAVSTWHHNKYRQNNYVHTLWKHCYQVCHEHFYHVGAKEENRNPMVEALLLNYPVPGKISHQDTFLKETGTPRQLELCI